ncbi:PAS domain S-box protein [Winogradskyella psychrotolerans]|uniref:PAS domain S-box protein n=1 Tax=Winogradskyella psychrotolerans TaxID=1344585 RepID=UPI001C07D4DA|nr:PAS domain S-box protein [Winogradskyella psychrotolerans]MBU2929782.1 PAS domain S-box protein [Winogradskyella psychrotolerans]
MKILEKSLKYKYLLFVFTFIFIIIAMLIFIQHSINSQVSDAHLINISGRQRMLSQNLTKLAFKINYNEANNVENNYIKTLDSILTEWETRHRYLHSINNDKWKNDAIDSLLVVNEKYQKEIYSAGMRIVDNYGELNIQNDVDIISSLEEPYLLNTDILVLEYQKATERHLKGLKAKIYIFVGIALLIVLCEFLFMVMPSTRKLLDKSKALLKANTALEVSEEKLSQNLDELNKLQSDLESREVFNKTFIEQIPAAVAMLDNDLRYISVSREWINVFKLEDEEVIGKLHYDVFPEISEAWREINKRCLNGETNRCDEAPFVRKDGTVQWVYWDTCPWYNEAGSIGGIVISTGDITKSKNKETKNKRLENILFKINEVARIGAWEVDLQNNKSFLSDVVRDIHGISKDYTITTEKGIQFYKEGKSRETLLKALNAAVNDGTPYDLELEMVNTKGEVIWVRSICQVERINGKSIRLYGLLQDINNRKLSQLALKKANAELNAIFNTKAIGIITTDLDRNINKFNPGAEILTGYSASEVIGKETPRFFHLTPELNAFKVDIAKRYGKRVEGFDAQLEMSKHNHFDMREWSYLRKDGSLLPVQSTLTSIKDEEGNHIGYLGVSTDITEKKIAENELLRKNQLLNFAEEITLMGNWQWDTIANSIQWSDSLYNIFQLDTSIRDLSFETYFDFVHPDDKDSVTAYFNNIEHDKRLNVFTHRIIAGDGKEKYIELLGEVITDENGHIIEMIGTCQDISASKAAEKKLYEAHTQLKAIFNSGPVAIMSSDNNGIINHFNAGAEFLLGYEAEEIVGKKEPEFFHIEEELERFKIDIAKKYNKTVQGFDPYNEIAKNNAFDTREWTFRKKDGSTFPVELTLTAIKNEKGEKIGFLGVSTDISERKQSQLELLRKNQLLSFAEELNLMGNWQIDFVNDKVKYSNNLYRILGLADNAEITYDTYLNFVHPEDKDMVIKHRDKLNEEKIFDDIVHKIKLDDGTVKIAQLRAQVITDGSGEIIEIFGTCQDVTAQRMAENKFRGLLESAPDAMVIVNEKGDIQLINKQAEKLFGYSADDLFEESVEILIPNQFTSNFKLQPHTELSESDLNALGAEKVKEFIGKNKDGKDIPIQVSLSPLETEEGLLISAAIRDITIQKSAQLKIINAKNDLERLAQKLIIQNTQLADFAQITSHNLRAPVSNLNALLGFYNDSNDDEKAMLFKKFEKVTQHLTNTLNTLVEAIKIRSDKTRKKEDIKFEDVLKNTTEILAGEIIETNAIIKTDFSKVPIINYDKIYLESIFLNLLSNTLRYKAKDRNPEVYIETAINNGQIELKIHDNGLGINLDRHGEKIFGLNKVFHRHPEAKGIGLYMTKTQIEAMGGTITVSSKINEGTTFTIQF